jgi:hypothetical protein
VRVKAHQLQQWYRTLDQLLACKAQIEALSVMGGTQYAQTAAASSLKPSIWGGWILFNDPVSLRPVFAVARSPGMVCRV